jgi:hypothetical protein
VGFAYMIALSSKTTYLSIVTDGQVQIILFQKKRGESLPAAYLDLERVMKIIAEWRLYQI